MGFLVDMAKRGYGSINDGNVPRRVFECYKDSEEIKGVNENLIYRCPDFILTLIDSLYILWILILQAYYSSYTFDSWSRKNPQFNPPY